MPAFAELVPVNAKAKEAFHQIVDVHQLAQHPSKSDCDRNLPRFKHCVSVETEPKYHHDVDEASNLIVYDDVRTSDVELTEPDTPTRDERRDNATIWTGCYRFCLEDALQRDSESWIAGREQLSVDLFACRRLIGA